MDPDANAASLLPVWARGRQAGGVDRRTGRTPRPSRAGGEHYNYETDKTEIIKNDGVSVSCFEKAGATYVYENGTFRQIVDSD